MTNQIGMRLLNIQLDTSILFHSEEASLHSDTQEFRNCLLNFGYNTFFEQRITCVIISTETLTIRVDSSVVAVV